MKQVIVALCAILLTCSALTYCPGRCSCKWVSNMSLIINCSTAELSEVPNGIDPEVEQLDLSLNELGEFSDPRNFANLEVLDLSFNKLSVVHFSKYMPNLSRVNLSHNKLNNLAQLQIENLANLEHLDLSYNTFLNQLTKLTSKSLQHLDVSHSFINFLQEGALGNLTALESLDLSHNSLRNIAALRSKTLETLDLSDGELRFITGQQLKHLPSLRKLNASHNTGLDVTFMTYDNETTCFNLTEVDFSFLEVSTVNISAFCKLEVLHVSHNHLRGVDEEFFRSNTELTTVFLSQNDIYEIHPKAFSVPQKIRFLDLSFNGLQDLTFTKYLKHLERLDLSWNSVNELNSLFLKSALYVNLSHNTIHQNGHNFDSSVPNLRVLDLSFNHVESVAPMISRTLRQLHLQDCQIISVESGAFRDLPSLQLLNLAGNKLTWLDYRILAQHKPLQSVSLGRNPWGCDCKDANFINLYTFLLVNTSLGQLDELHCSRTPEEYKKNWKEVCLQEWKDEAVSLTSKKTFYSLLTTFIVIVVIIVIVAACRVIRMRKENRASRQSAQTSEELITVERDSLEPPRRASTPPPNYEDALLMPKLTDQQRELAMSVGHLDHV